MNTLKQAVEYVYNYMKDYEAENTDLLDQNALYDMMEEMLLEAVDGVLSDDDMKTWISSKDDSYLDKILNERLDHYSGRGVKVTKVQDDTWTQMNIVYDPSHPDADENGYVTYPNVNTVTEMTNLIDASRSYEANATAFNASKNLATRGLEIGNG